MKARAFVELLTYVRMKESFASNFQPCINCMKSGYGASVLRKRPTEHVLRR